MFSARRARHLASNAANPHSGGVGLVTVFALSSCCSGRGEASNSGRAALAFRARRLAGRSRASVTLFAGVDALVPAGPVLPGGSGGGRCIASAVRMPARACRRGDGLPTQHGGRRSGASPGPAARALVRFAHPLRPAATARRPALGAARPLSAAAAGRCSPRRGRRGRGGGASALPLAGLRGRRAAGAPPARPRPAGAPASGACGAASGDGSSDQRCRRRRGRSPSAPPPRRRAASPSPAAAPSRASHCTVRLMRTSPAACRCRWSGCSL